MGDPPLRALIAGAVTFPAPVSVIWLIGDSPLRMLISVSLARLYWIRRGLQIGGRCPVAGGQCRVAKESLIGQLAGERLHQALTCQTIGFSLRELTRQLVAVDDKVHSFLPDLKITIAPNTHFALNLP